MDSELKRDLMAALERSHRLGTIGGNLEEQLAHCASFSSVLARVAPEPFHRGLDLGTGGGLPGLALACLWPEPDWLLVDLRAARIDELDRVLLRLGLGSRVQAQAIEAQRLGQDLTHREQYDVVVARSFGHPSLVAECAAGLLRNGGALIVSEPPEQDNASGEAVERWPASALERLGFAPPERHLVDGSRFVVLIKTHDVPEAIPRLPARASRGWY